MAWTDQAPLTVGDLRAAMEGLPDDAQIFTDGDPDRPIVEALHSRQVPFGTEDTWHAGDPVVVGLELWLGGDEAFPAPRCQHTARGKVPVTDDRREVAIEAAARALDTTDLHTEWDALPTYDENPDTWRPIAAPIVDAVLALGCDCAERLEAETRTHP
jgi:hypothetical protein